NAQVNRYMRELTLPPDYNKDNQIRQTAGALSKELLYMKFLQGIPLVGAVGGVYDVVYMKNITEYAKIKYQRRFLRTKG
ncbi:MAG: EcsC family protein, partial [Ruminiclostridium sp.]|nr:EcsC family protein [Ruminiclostridium sp.]